MALLTYYASLLLLVVSTLAHMQLVFPAPFNASNNPHRTTPPDPYLQYPYDCCGPNDRWTYPCRGYLSLLGTSEGAPTAQWKAGSIQTWNISGIGNHYGGSCQVGFSTDKGKTFRVATSYEGNCPHRNNGDGPQGQNFDFVVPQDLPAGIQVFAWVWYNREQEFNMNCAAVNITGMPEPTCTVSLSAVAPPSVTDYYTGFGPALPSPTGLKGGSLAGSSGSIAFEKRPLMLIADNDNGCITPKTTAEVKYPDPGPDIVPGDGVYPLQLPVGNCYGPNMLAHQGYDGSNGNDGHS